MLPGPKSLCRASSYFFCFDSLSSRAFCCRSSKDRICFPGSFSSSSSSSSILSCCNPVEPTAPVALGVGLRLRTFTAGLKSVFKGTSSRVLRKYESLGASLQARKDEPSIDNPEGETYASSHNCLLNSACLARRSALESFLLLGGLSVVLEEDCVESKK